MKRLSVHLVGGLSGSSLMPEYWATLLLNGVASTLSGFDGIGFDTLARRTLAVAVRMGET